MAKKVDDNGWWIIKDNPLSKVGIYPYLGKQIDDSLEPNKIYRVFRPAEELLNEETVKSFHLVPLINDHEMLGKDYEPAEEKGIDGIVSNPRPAHGDMLIGDIKIFSEKMMDDIKHGKKELSMGYTCTYDLTPGDWDGQHYDVVQRNLKGNHVALVDRGRMGSDVRVYDKHICCDSMNISLKNVKRINAQDISHKTWQLRKDTGLNYLTPRKESTINRLIKESGLPIARKTEATKLFGDANYRNRFDAKFKKDEDWVNAQKIRFQQTRRKVGVNKMLGMPSYQRYLEKQEQINDILARRHEIERQVYGDKAGLDGHWIKVPKEEQEEPNIIERVIQKSAEEASLLALLDTVLNMKRKKLVKDSLISDLKENSIGGALLGGILGGINPQVDMPGSGYKMYFGPGRGILSGAGRGAVFGAGTAAIHHGLKKVFPKINPSLALGLSTAGAIPLTLAGTGYNIPLSMLATGVISGTSSALNSYFDKKGRKKK